jgi:hypothetical protein
MMAVAMPYDPPALVARYAETRMLPFDVAIDDTDEIARRFDDVCLAPTTLPIEARGVILERQLGEPDFGAFGRACRRIAGRA